MRALSNGRCFRQNIWGLNELVFSRKTLIHEKPLIHETCWTRRSIKCMDSLAAGRELPKSSCEWEMSGGHV